MPKAGYAVTRRVQHNYRNKYFYYSCILYLPYCILTSTAYLLLRLNFEPYLAHTGKPSLFSLEFLRVREICLECWIGSIFGMVSFFIFLMHIMQTYVFEKKFIQKVIVMLHLVLILLKIFYSQVLSHFWSVNHSFC